MENFEINEKRYDNNIKDKTYSNVTFNKCTFSGRLKNVTFINCKFQNCIFDNANIRDVEFNDATLENMDCVVFRNCIVANMTNLLDAMTMDKVFVISCKTLCGKCPFDRTYNRIGYKFTSMDGGFNILCFCNSITGNVTVFDARRNISRTFPIDDYLRITNEEYPNDKLHWLNIRLWKMTLDYFITAYINNKLRTEDETSDI